MVLTDLVLSLGIPVGVVAFQAILTLITKWLEDRRASAPGESLQSRLAGTLQALDDNSSRALGLISELQVEVSKRATTVREIEKQIEELRQQRIASELSEEQKEAIRTLVRRQPTVKEVFTSLDFWAGRVLVSGFFFAMGIVFCRML